MMKKKAISIRISKIAKYIEYVCFSVAIILQNFALIRTDKFGIAASTCVLVFFFFRYRLFRFLSLRLAGFLGVTVLLLVANGLLNNSVNVMQILRILMIVFDIWATFMYVKVLSAKERSTFVRVFIICYIMMCVYGLYEYYAQSHGLPRFLNYFSNNPSYGVRSPFSVNEGWSKSSRIFTCFFEPSVFSVFLIYGYIFIMKNLKWNGKRVRWLAIGLSILFVTVLVLSGARTGFLYLLYAVLALVASKVFKKNVKAQFLLKCLFVVLPILTLIGSASLGLATFNDLSVAGRTSSSLYYSKATFESPSSVIIGHGAGSMSAGKDGVLVDGVKIENHAHNGYVEVAYQYGIVILVLFIYCIIRIIEAAPDKDKLLLYALAFSLACTGELYAVETLAIITTLIYSYSFWGERLAVGAQKLERKKES